MKIGKFDFGNNPVIMGILNITPDSFSDGGKYNEIDKALVHVEQMIADGAEIIDVGGESTRPGYIEVSPDEEINRVIPVIEAIKDRFDVPISLDTYKYQVAQAGISAGCHMINDIWGLKWDQGQMAKLISKSKTSICIMHNRKESQYNQFLEDVMNDLEESINIAIDNGINNEKIIIDPGVGFAKDYIQNLTIINNLSKFKQLGYPILLGTSRKSVIGLALDVEKDDRVAGTIATTVMGYERGCQIFRVHDVKENYQALKFAQICRNQG